MTTRRSFQISLLAAALATGAQAQNTAAPASSVRVLAVHPVVHALASALTQGSAIEVLRPAPATLPPGRLAAFFAGRGAAPLALAAASADAVLGLRSVWPDDPLFPLARRANIRIVEIDAARPLDGALPGLALRSEAGAAPIDSLPWLDPVNLGRMADVIAADLGRLVPAAAAAITTRLAHFKQRLVRCTAQSEAGLAGAANLSVLSLSPRLDYLVSGFNLDLVGRDLRDDDAWTPAALAELSQRLRRDSVAAVLHHRELPATLMQAVQAGGARLIVLRTEGQDPLAELQDNVARLGVLAEPR